MARSYSDQVNDNNILLIRQILAELPPYVKIFIRGIEPTTASRTRVGY